jgi:hypothetical protein
MGIFERLAAKAAKRQPIVEAGCKAWIRGELERASVKLYDNGMRGGGTSIQM